MALWSALGVLGSRMNNGSGCDDRLIAVSKGAVLCSVSQRDAEISISSRQRNEDTSHEINSVVLYGGYGIEIGTGVGCALVREVGLYRAWNCAKRFTSVSFNSVRCSGRATPRLKAVPVVFRTFRSNSPRREAVITVLR